MTTRADGHTARSIHYTDGIVTICPNRISPVPAPCASHPDAVLVVQHDVASRTPVDPRVCTRCGAGRNGCQVGPYLCDDCAEVVDRAWARILSDPAPAPWLGLPPRAGLLDERAQHADPARDVSPEVIARTMAALGGDW